MLRGIVTEFAVLIDPRFEAAVCTVQALQMSITAASASEQAQLDEATALQQAPRRNPYAKMLRREKGYYEHLARRLSRYLSALAD